MTKTPSALKWLAEKRARLANDVALTTKMAQELAARQLALEKKLAALDETIGLYDAAIDPSSIAPVAHWAGRYGKRGALRDALLELLTRHAPDWVAADNIERMLIAHFGINFLTATQRADWRRNALGGGLRRLVYEGRIERQDEPETRTGKQGFWRLKPARATTLADL